MYQLVKVSALNNNTCDAEIILSWPDKMKKSDMLSYADYCNKGSQANYNNKYTNTVYTFFILKNFYGNDINSINNLDLYEKRVRE